MTKSGKIFISYTHVDKEYLQDLKKYIQPLLRFQYSEYNTPRKLDQKFVANKIE